MSTSKIPLHTITLVVCGQYHLRTIDLHDSRTRRGYGIVRDCRAAICALGHRYGNTYDEIAHWVGLGNRSAAYGAAQQGEKLPHIDDLALLVEAHQ